ncbi:UvrB/UvrC motif-containing protein [Clostridium tarantellae]|uniref:Excinuclease n=1 Tax=Clostridium tarantellae TaxID=39493 RepID=A0A6I1MPY1_9CLOT|nr:UvrB/UvrC motif-containing protein [Clostridium tarantellae]MPQ42349.1 excinuclease [Clostridium tarantellae]
MLCEKCNKNEATISIVKIINGNREQMMVCEQCASRLIDKPISNFKDLDGEEFKKLLSTLMDIPNKDKSIDFKKLKCDICNLSYKDIKEKEALGCGNCYKIFYDVLNECNKINKNNIYQGKFPKKYGEKFQEKVKIKLLSEELKTAISTEDYEQAAKLRDKIKELSKRLEGDNING